MRLSSRAVQVRGREVWQEEGEGCGFFQGAISSAERESSDTIREAQASQRRPCYNDIKQHDRLPNKQLLAVLSNSSMGGH